MSAIPAHGPARYRRAPALRTLVAAGGWSNGLILSGMALAMLVRLLPIDEGKAFGLGLSLATVCTTFWAMLAGARLSGTAVQSARLRMPRVGRLGLAWLGWALLLAALLPAVVFMDAGRYGLAVAALACGAALGIFWVSIPPWTMWLVIGLGVAARWLPFELDGAALRAAVTSAPLVACAALALLAASALGWWREARRTGNGGAWSTPIALSMLGGMNWSQAWQQGPGGQAPAGDTPVGSNLRRAPRQALGIALGPGFGRASLKSVLATQGPIVAVIVLWVLLGVGAEGRGASDVSLKFAPLLVLSSALAPLLRLQALYLRPGLGLHELALLPGLPARAPAQSLVMLLLRCILARMLPSLALLAGFGLYAGAPAPYFQLLVWTSFAGAALFGGLVLLSLHSKAMRGVAIVLVVAVTLAILATMTVPPGAGWQMPAWSVALLAGTALWSLGAARLRARPHPWLQN